MRRLAVTALALCLVAAPALGQSVVVPLEDLDAQLGEALSTLERASADRARAEAELSGLADARAAAQRRVRDRARALYRMRHAGALPLAGGFSALLAHLGRSARLGRMLEHDLTSLAELRRRGDALTGEIARAETAGNEARDRVTRLESERRSAEIAGLEAALGASTFRDVVEHALGPSTGGSLVVRDTATSASDPAGAFESLRGTLTLPIASPNRITEEARDDGAALSFAASPGSRVRAASAGRVAYAGRHSAYGRLVILDHGGSYFTVYGGLGTIGVSVGDELPAGASIGVIDRDPLLFQVRRGTRALPPRAWLGL
jgi:murein hydrolase activator